MARRPDAPSAYVNAVNSLFIQPNQLGAVPSVLFTPEQLYPLTGVRSLYFDASVQQGLTILNNAILGQLAAGNHVTVFGYSQRAEIASLEMRQIAVPGVRALRVQPTTRRADGDLMNPNGGLLERFVGLSLPSMGLTMFGATPDNLYSTVIYTRERRRPG